MGQLQLVSDILSEFRLKIFKTVGDMSDTHILKEQAL